MVSVSSKTTGKAGNCKVSASKNNTVNSITCLSPLLIQLLLDRILSGLRNEPQEEKLTVSGVLSPETTIRNVYGFPVSTEKLSASNCAVWFNPTNGIKPHTIKTMLTRIFIQIKLIRCFWLFSQKTEVRLWCMVRQHSGLKSLRLPF